MMPAFDLQGGLPLAFARAASVGGLLSVFGTLCFEVLVAPKAYARMAQAEIGTSSRRLHSLAMISLLGAGLGTAAWLLLEAGDIAGADTVRGNLAAIWPVLRKTFFGHVIAAQTGILVLLAMAIKARHKPGTRPILLSRPALLPLALVTLAIVLQAGHSHAWSMHGGPSLLLAADILHLLGAGAWLGGLLPLILLVQTAAPRAGAIAARWFSPMGQWCIAALTVSALYQGWTLVATIPGLLGTAYGWLILSKILFSTVLLGFAAANRYRFAPGLLQEAPEFGRRILIRSIVVQTGFGAAIVLAAAILSGLPPAMHEQALWPFAYRFSLAAINEDPDFRREVLQAALALGAAMSVLLAALARRRFRLPAAGAAAVVAWLAIPHFDLLLVPAYPTSFYHSPTGFSAGSIVTGATVFAQNCMPCHGKAGQGDGPVSKTLPIPPADLTAAHLWMHTDGELFWWVGHGMQTPEGRQAMPGFAATLDDDQIWAVIDYIHANNAGALMRNAGHFPPAIQAPAFGATCGDDQPKLADFRGRYVRVVFGASPETTVPETADLGGAVTIIAGTDATTGTLVFPPGFCVVRDETVPRAYAIVSGMPDAALPQSQFLIDDAGWLRAMQPAGARRSWDSPARLAADIAKLRAQPIAPAGSMPMAMSMPMAGPMARRAPGRLMQDPAPMQMPAPKPEPSHTPELDQEPMTMPMPEDHK